MLALGDHLTHSGGELDRFHANSVLHRLRVASTRGLASPSSLPAA